MFPQIHCPMFHSKPNFSILRGLCRTFVGLVHDRPLSPQEKIEERVIAPRHSPSSMQSHSEVISDRLKLYAKDSKDQTTEVESSIEKSRQTQSPIPDGLSSTAASVPTSSWARGGLFGVLAVRLAADYLRRPLERGSNGLNQQRFTPSAHKHIVETLCHMRGATLKLAQMFSIQEDSVIPSAALEVFTRVRDAAVYMPQTQMESLLNKELGKAWKERCDVDEFHSVPFAAASIGQVHYCVARGKRFAVKVQFPGVRESIRNDTANIRRLSFLKLLPPGLFVGSLLDSLEKELESECNYTSEALMQNTYRSYMQRDPDLSLYIAPLRLIVPEINSDMSTSKVLTSSFCDGKAIDKMIPLLSQDEKDLIGRTIIFLTMKELFHWKFMQTDPNFANFLFNRERRELQLIDFGATRSYREDFVSRYHQIVSAGSRGSKEEIIHHSIALGLLTGEESKQMMDAHCTSVMILARPYRCEGVFDFAAERVSQLLTPHVKIMLAHRLRPPPLEVYSLHRRLSGAFLLCARLNARVNVHHMWEHHFSNYKEMCANFNFEDCN